MSQMQDEVKAALKHAVDEMAQYYDRWRSPTPAYKVGAKVWLNAQNYTTTHCKHLNSELGAQTVLHLSVSKGVIQRKRESWSSATSSSNDNSRPGPMAQVVHTGMKYVLFT